MTDANTNFEALFAGLPEDILQCKLAGDFQNAVRLIDLRLQEQHLPQALRRCLTAEREMILRLPDEFPFSREEALALVRQHIPDFTEEEFDRFVDARKIRWIYRQGEPCYFGRFFDSLCKIDAGFARRAGVSLPGAESAGRLSEKEAQMDACIRQMKQKGSASRRIRIRASLQIPEEHFTPGMQVTAHLPIPLECDSQRGIRVERMFPENGILAPKDALQRTVCWQETLETNHAFMIEYSYTRTARYRDLWKGPLPAENPAKTLSEEELRPFLAEEPPHILFTPYLKALAAELTEGADHPLEKARRFYDFITENMTYTYMPSYFTQENLAETCARNFTGDCGIFALLFVTLCRCAGIPAAWESGLTAEPDFCGAHDWTRFYIPEYGWLYADPSYGTAAVRNQDPERRKFYFGNLDPFRMAANRGFQKPFDPPKRHWRCDPYDNQLGEIETDTRGLLYEEFTRSKQVLLCEETEEGGTPYGVSQDH